jgi:hypothetical protein
MITSHGYMDLEKSKVKSIKAILCHEQRERMLAKLADQKVSASPIDANMRRPFSAAFASCSQGLQVNCCIVNFLCFQGLQITWFVQ